jgi:hypothetical protein
MSRERADYTSFLLRVWRVPGATAIWIASLEHPRTGERLSFADLESLFAFLAAHTAALAQHRQDESDAEIGSAAKRNDDDCLPRA